MFLIIALLCYIFWDVNYFLRLALTYGISRIQKKVGIFETTCIYGFCTTQDVDFFFSHMNNARYLRELDFARIHYYSRTGLLAKSLELGAKGLLGASNIRYRRAIPIFTPYKVESKLLYWEKNMIYMEHKFITMSDGFVRAVILSRQSLVGADVATLFRGLSEAEEPPACTPDLRHWLQSMEISSEQLRKND